MNHSVKKHVINMVELQTFHIPAFQQYAFWCHQYSIVTDKYEAMENVCDAQLGIEVGQRQQRYKVIENKNIHGQNVSVELQTLATVHGTSTQYDSLPNFYINNRQWVSA